MSAYGRLCTEFYDLDKPEAPEEALAFVLKLAGAYGEPILEPMCGSGRFLLPLARAGFDVDGVDNSPDMLAACRRRLTTAGIEARLYEQSLESMMPSRQYRMAFIPDASICLLTDEERLREALRRVRASLLPGGVFAVGAVTPRFGASEESTVSGRWVTRPDGSMILLTSVTRYDAPPAILRSINRYESFAGHELLETEFEEFDLRLYEEAEFTRHLRDAGFVQIETQKAYEDQISSADDHFILSTCRRPR